MNPLDLISKVNIDSGEIISYLTSTELQDTLLPFRIAFLAISAILVGLLIFLMSRTHYWELRYFRDVTQFVTMKPYGAKKITKQWNKIAERLATGLESEYKLAIIEADDLLDSSLKRVGFAGQTLEEKLGTMTSAALPSIDEVSEIHRLRNSIVYDPDYRLTLDEAKKALAVYEQAFHDLQVLGE